MSAALIIKGAELALNAIDLLSKNKMNETEMFSELNKPEYIELGVDQKMRIVRMIVDGKGDDAQAAIDGI